MTLGFSPISSDAISSGGGSSGGGGATETPISGETTVSLSGIASLKLGTSIAAGSGAAITGSASIQTGTHLAAIGRIEATPRGRLAGTAATPGAGNFFLLF